MKKRWVWLVVIILLLLGGGAYSYYRFFMSPAQAQGEPSLQTTQVRRGDVVLSVSGTGNLLPGKEKELGFSTSGTLAALQVEVGDQVHAGDILARLDTRELELQLAQAKSSLAQKEASLEQLLAGATAAELIAARNSLLQATTNLSDQEVSVSVATERARLNWMQAANNLRDVQASYSETYWANRQLEDRLARRGQSLPQANIDAEAQAWRAVENAEGAMEQARLAYEQAKQQQESSLTTARAQVSTAQANLDSLIGGASAADIASAQAAVEQARISYELAQMQLDKAGLVAPFDGTVMAVSAQVGDQVGSSAIITLADLAAPLVRVWVEESDMSSVAPGNAVQIVFEALPDRTFTGEVIRVEPALVTVDNTSAVQAWASMDLGSQPVQLLSGLAAEVEVIAAEARSVLLVPLEALREISTGQYAVFVVQQDGSLELRPVEVGLEDLVSAEIRSGLSLGEVVSLGATTGSSSAAASATPGTLPGGGRFIPGGGDFVPPPGEGRP